MTILGRGDLSPPRRARRARRARRSSARVGAILVALAVLGAAGWFGWRAWHGSGSHRHTTAPRVCVTPTPAPTPAPAAAFVLTVLNSTPRVGMAHAVAAALAARGFRVGHVGNTTPQIAAVAAVDYGPGLRPAALTVAEQIQGAQVVEVGRPGIAVVLGSRFRGLAPVPVARASQASDLSAAAPRPVTCTSP